MADGRAKLDAWIKMLRTLPADVTREAAPAVADALRADIEASVSRAQSPDGTPWKPKLDGEQALVDAAQDVTVTPLDSVVLVKFTGKFVRHHRGMARGGIKRQVIPTRKVPDAVLRTISRVFATAFRRQTGAA